LGLLQVGPGVGRRWLVDDGPLSGLVLALAGARLGRGRRLLRLLVLLDPGHDDGEEGEGGVDGVLLVETCKNFSIPFASGLDEKWGQMGKWRDFVGEK
jgi:hypothetical protein